MSKANKIYVVLLSAVYLLLTVGFGLRTHYCHGDISSITYVTASPDCECGDEESEMSCCTTVDQYFQFSEIGVISQSYKKIPAPIDGTSIVHADFIPQRSYNFIDVQSFDQEVSGSPPRYILHSSLILYS